MLSCCTFIFGIRTFFLTAGNLPLRWNLQTIFPYWSFINSHCEFIFTHLVIQASVSQAHILEEGSNKLASKQFFDQFRVSSYLLSFIHPRHTSQFYWSDFLGMMFNSETFNPSFYNGIHFQVKPNKTSLRHKDKTWPIISWQCCHGNPSFLEERNSCI